jgi:hypothetical protein
MPINSFKKKILAWDEFDKSFYVLKNSINIKIEDLLFIEKQKQILLENTILFAKGMPSNNVLLWGARGTGKSSLIFSVFNYVKEKYDIALLEIKRNQLKYINTILRQLNNIDQKIIIFFDDFSFASNSNDFIVFKNILDGAVSRNLNFLFYTTSNFRSIIQHNNKSNMDMIEQQEALDNETALSDRFGIWLGFEKFTNNQYLEIVNYYCLKFNMKNKKEFITSKALQWSLNRGAKSGREAYHFVKSLHNKKI